MVNLQTQLRSGVFDGIRKGLKSFSWICKIVIPVSFLVTLLQWTNFLRYLDFLLEPLMSFINLPTEASLPIITGMLLGIYSVIAIITVIPFSLDQMTLIAIFTMISHALIIEGIIQHKSGLNIFKASVIRLSASVVAVLVVSRFLGDTSESVAVSVDLMVYKTIAEVSYNWLMDIVGLLIKVFGIVMFVMIILESLKALGWIEYSIKFFRPLLRILGLSDRTATMCIVGIVFGLMYGGTVIVEEMKKGDITKEELESLHISIGINHAIIEDPAIFAVLGLHTFWLLCPRLIMAIIAVQIYRGIRYLKKVLKWL